MNMPASSLVAMAQRALARNISIYDDIYAPYELVRPVLKKVDNPDHLRRIEENSPHIAEFSAEIWKAFIARDIPRWEEKILEPKNPRSWGKVYRKLMRDEERRKTEDEQRLAATMNGIQAKKEANKANIVHAVIPQSRSESRYESRSSSRRTQPWEKQSAVERGSVRAAKTGKDVMTAIRRQTVNAQQQRGLMQAKPRNTASQIRQAPMSMVKAHTKPVPPPVRTGPIMHAPPAKVFTSRTGPTEQERALNQAIRNEQAEKERRLKALTTARAPPNPAPRETARPVVRSPPQSVSNPPGRQKSMGLAVGGDLKRKLSPSPASSPAPPPQRKRPAADMFVAKKKVKI